jgi:hypothetical protein
MATPPVPVSFLTALQSFDVGEFIAPDGRAHVVDAHLPITFGPVVTPEGQDTVQVNPTVAAEPTGPTYTPVAAVSQQDNGAGVSLFHLHMPQHLGARVAIGVIAVLLIVIAVARLVFD